MTSGMRRVTLAGDGLRAHAAPSGHPVGAFRSDGFDDEFKLILPDPVTGAFTAPAQADGVLHWPGDSFSATRTYTVRRWDPDELLEIAPGVAIRVAVTLGVIRRLGLEPQTSADLAAAVGADAGALDRLLRYLAALDVVARTEGDAGGVWSLRPLGSELDDDRYTEVLSLDTATGRTAVGIVGLLDAVRSGGSGHVATFGGTFAELVDADDRLSRSRLHSELAEWTATPLAASGLLAGTGDLRVAGPGSGDIVRAIVAQHPDARVRLLVPPSQVEAARELFAADAGRVEIETGGLLDRRREPSDAYLLVGALAEFGDEDAMHVLAEAAASTRSGEVLVLEDPFSPEAGDEHELEHDLELLAVHGGALRTDADLDALAHGAGLAAAGRETVGWGRVLRRYAGA